MFRQLYISALCYLGFGIDIDHNGPYPAFMLSNLEPYKFAFRGKQFRSIESLFQGLKYRDIAQQNRVFEKVGIDAKVRRARSNWQASQTLYWQGEPMGRHSKEYKDCIDEAYAALAANSDFCEALLATGNKCLYNSYAKTNSSKTVLTSKEQCKALMRLRKKLKDSTP